MATERNTASAAHVSHTRIRNRGSKGRTLTILDGPAGEEIIWGMWTIDPNGKRPPLPLGAHPQNTGGKKGRSGRKKKTFKAMCRTVLNHPELARRFMGILKEGDNKDLLSMVKTAAEYTLEKPKTTTEITSSSLEELVEASRQQHTTPPQPE